MRVDIAKLSPVFCTSHINDQLMRVYIAKLSPVFCTSHIDDSAGLLVTIYLGLACNVASIALLIPAIGIFVLYRYDANKSHRVVNRASVSRYDANKSHRVVNRASVSRYDANKSHHVVNRASVSRYDANKSHRVVNRASVSRYDANKSHRVVNRASVSRYDANKSHRDVNRASVSRRALKATFVLIPLFGVQLFVAMYRLPPGRSGGPEYEKFSVCIRNSQVITHVKRTCTRMRLMRMPTEASRAQTTATSVNFVNHGPDSHESENGTLMYESPRPSPGPGKKVYNTMELNERKYPYIPLAVKEQSTPTEM
ncbi:hypothetical protein Btru_059601 [Bulinus truncatus]|nr:hypothetical protein Btru_059601 [Bulinus truncatus]